MPRSSSRPALLALPARPPSRRRARDGDDALASADAALLDVLRGPETDASTPRAPCGEFSRWSDLDDETPLHLVDAPRSGGAEAAAGGFAPRRRGGWVHPVLRAGPIIARVFVTRHSRARADASASARVSVFAVEADRASRSASAAAAGDGASFPERGCVLPPLRERSFRHGESLLRDGRAETRVVVVAVHHRVVFVAPVSSSFGTLHRLGRERLERGSLAFAVHQRRAQPLDLARAASIAAAGTDPSASFAARAARSSRRSGFRRPRRLVQRSALSLERTLQLERDGLAQPQPPLEVLARRLRTWAHRHRAGSGAGDDDGPSVSMRRSGFGVGTPGDFFRVLDDVACVSRRRF